MNLFQKGYSEESQKFKEGMYVSAIRYTTDVYKTFKSHKALMLKDNWSNLTDLQRRNIHSTLIEASMIAIMAAISSIMFAAYEDDDELKDNKFFTDTLFIANRLKSELLFYSSPGTAIDILRSPAASISIMEKAGSLLSRIITLNYDEEYVNGDRKGELKITKDIEGIFPIIRMRGIYEDIDSESRLSIFKSKYRDDDDE